MNNWPQIIRNIMKAEKATQRRVEVATGVSRSTLKRVLRGESPMRVDQLEDVLRAFGYSITIHKTGEASPLVKRAPSTPKRAPILPKLIKAAGMGMLY